MAGKLMEKKNVARNEEMRKRCRKLRSLMTTDKNTRKDKRWTKNVQRKEENMNFKRT